MAGAVSGSGRDSHKDEHNAEIRHRSTRPLPTVRRHQSHRDRRRASTRYRKQRGYFHCRHFAWRYGRLL